MRALLNFLKVLFQVFLGTIITAIILGYGIHLRIPAFYLVLLYLTIVLSIFLVFWYFEKPKQVGGTTIKKKGFFDWLWDYLRTRNAYSKLIASIYTGIAAGIAIAYREEIGDETKEWLAPLVCLVYELAGSSTAVYGVTFYWVFFVLWLVVYMFFIFGENANNLESKQSLSSAIEGLRSLTNKVKDDQAELSVEQTESISALKKLTVQLSDDQQKQRKAISDQNWENIKKVNNKFEDTLTDIRASLHNAPNPDIFELHISLYSSILQTLLQINDERSPLKTELIRVEWDWRLQLVLKFIVEITEKFSRLKDAVFGANLMIYIPMEANEEIIRMLKKRGPEHFIYYDEWELDKFIGVLHSIEPLIHHGEGRFIPAITLPIMRKPADRLTRGACAVIDTRATIVNDVSEFKDSRPLISEASEKFFSNEGLGRHIKSIISIQVPVTSHSTEFLKSQGKAVVQGVLNIDCSATNPLGKVKDYKDTFVALMSPIAYAISPYLQEYTQLYLAELRSEKH